MVRGWLVLAALMAGLAGCSTYRPGRDGSLPILPQNASSNSEPEPAGSRPR